MSSPENVDPHEAEEGRSEEEHLPRKTRYGRIIVPKGGLPGEDLIPRNHKKKDKPEEPIRTKRKYTKRKHRDTANNGKEKSATEEHKIEDVKKEIKNEEIDIIEENNAQNSEEEEEDDVQPGDFKRVSVLSRKNVYFDIDGLGDEAKPEACDICGSVMPKFKLELHKLDSHPEYAPYECVSCRIRQFWDYFELKEHYKVCSNALIASDTYSERQKFKGVVEATYYRKLYQAVECPYCMIWLGTYYDLDVHFNSHGLAAIDAKFGCDGCKMAFVSVDALKKHFYKANNPKPSPKCFNTCRPLNRKEIEKLKERFNDADREDSLRRFNHATYTLAPLTILERFHEAVCAYCDRPTKAYADLKIDLANLTTYGLECGSEEIKNKIKDKIKYCKEKKHNRVAVCRDHFQWKNWLTKSEKAELPEARKKKELVQNVISREIEVNNMKVDDSWQLFQTDNTNNIKQEVVDLDDEVDGMPLFRNGDVKKEEREECESVGSSGEGMYDCIDICDDEPTSSGSGHAPLSPIMDDEELEEKMCASLKISYLCPVCQASLPTLQDLHEHQDVHPDRKLQYLCADCPNKIFETPDDVNMHFDDKKKSAVAAFYSFKVIVIAEGQLDSTRSSIDEDETIEEYHQSPSPS